MVHRFDIKVDKEYISSGEGQNEMRVSATGILYPNIASYTQPFMSSSTMVINGKGKKYLLAIDQNVQAGDINGREVVKPKLSYSGEFGGDSIVYAIELEDWRSIREIKLGNSGFYFTQEGRSYGADAECG